jgi:hypothetical protein
MPFGRVPNTDITKAAMEKLATDPQKMGSALCQQQPTPEGGPTADAGSQSQQADDVVNVEIVTKTTTPRRDHCCASNARVVASRGSRCGT